MEKLIQHHPLQRMPSPSWGSSAVVHLIGLSSFANSYKYLHEHPNHINTSYGWHFQYLTIIGLTLCTLTFLSGLLADLTSSTRLFRAKNLFSITAAPMAVLISQLYWTLRAINPALVVPPELELPLSVDLGFHAAPAVLLLIDILLFSPPWTITALPSLLISTIIAFAYWFWIEWCYQHNGFYPYPIFGLLNTTQRVGLFALSASLMASVSGLLGWLSAVVNGVEDTNRKNERSGNVKGSSSRR